MKIQKGMPLRLTAVLCLIALLLCTRAFAVNIQGLPVLQQQQDLEMKAPLDVAHSSRELAGKPATSFPANVHRCVHSATKLAKQTLAGAPCLSCDPALAECNPGCQLLINGMYHVCTKMCLPDGYYFDPPMTLSGCFNDNLAELKIAVERCGCNSGFGLRDAGQTLLQTIMLTFLLSCVLLIKW